MPWQYLCFILLVDSQFKNMLALRGTLNAGLVKALGINSSVPVPSSLSITSVVLKRNQSTVPQSGTDENGNFQF